MSNLLTCKSCKNNKTWSSLTISKGQYIATCFDCGTVNKGFGPVSVDTVIGSSTFYVDGWRDDK